MAFDQDNPNVPKPVTKPTPNQQLRCVALDAALGMASMRGEDAELPTLDELMQSATVLEMYLRNGT